MCTFHSSMFWRVLYTKMCRHLLQSLPKNLLQICPTGRLGWAMVLGSFQCRGILLHLHIVGQGPAVLAAGAGWVGNIFFIFFIYLPFLMSCLLGDG